MSTCRTCDAEIVWARTVKGKAIPLDVDPTPDGNVVLLDGVAEVLGPLEVAANANARRYMPHHATCTNWSR